VQFKKDLKLLKKRSVVTFNKLALFVENLEQTGFEGVNKTYKPHYLSSNYKDCCECHMLNDYVLIWREDKKSMVIELLRTGTHSDLF
jgi:mRNA interferase YafQ